MYFVRGFAVIIGFIGAALVSYLSNVELFKVLALASFVLTVDSLAVRYIRNLYMQKVYAQMSGERKKDDSSPK